MTADPQVVYDMLHEAACVMGPDEILVLRSAEGWRYEKVGRIHKVIDAFNERHGTNIKVLMVPGDEMKVLKVEQ